MKNKNDNDTPRMRVSVCSVDPISVSVNRGNYLIVVRFISWPHDENSIVSKHVSNTFAKQLLQRPQRQRKTNWIMNETWALSQSQSPSRMWVQHRLYGLLIYANKAINSLMPHYSMVSISQHISFAHTHTWAHRLRHENVSPARTTRTESKLPKGFRCM